MDALLLHKIYMEEALTSIGISCEETIKFPVDSNVGCRDALSTLLLCLEN